MTGDINKYIIIDYIKGSVPDSLIESQIERHLKKTMTEWIGDLYKFVPEIK